MYSINNNIENENLNSDNEFHDYTPNYYPCRSCSNPSHYSQLDRNEGLCSACVREDI